MGCCRRTPLATSQWPWGADPPETQWTALFPPQSVVQWEASWGSFMKRLLCDFEPRISMQRPYSVLVSNRSMWLDPAQEAPGQRWRELDSGETISPTGSIYLSIYLSIYWSIYIFLFICLPIHFFLSLWSFSRLLPLSLALTLTLSLFLSAAPSGAQTDEGQRSVAQGRRCSGRTGV